MINRGGRTASFIVRIWLEAGRSGERSWRGHIQHVQSGKDAYFHDLQRMLDFLETIGGVTFPGGSELPKGGSGWDEGRSGGPS